MESGSDFQSYRRTRVTVSEVTLRSFYGGILKVAGSVTGKQYQWDRSGAEVKVDTRDSKALLERRYGGCCGGTSYALFELVNKEG